MTLEAFVGYALQGLFLGIILGGLDAWDKRVYYAVWMIAAVFALGTSTMMGAEEYGASFISWRSAITLLFMFPGWFAAQAGYKDLQQNTEGDMN